jgi:PTH1 family peptidyl-tRNA hydrolase
LPAPIQLIVGLGNPGEKYALTRHNAGAWFVDLLLERFRGQWRVESKLNAELAKVSIANETVWLMKSTTYMNHSGQAVKAVSHFYKIPPEQILVVHDELAFDPGIARFKEGGGHGGHNGLRDIIQHLGKPSFHRLRLGVGHPGNPDAVVDYVLKQASRHDYDNIMDASGRAMSAIEDYVSGNQQKAIRELHNQPAEGAA